MALTRGQPSGSLAQHMLVIAVTWLKASEAHADTSIFDFSTLYGKQLFFMGVAFLGIIFVLFVESNFFERFSSIFYTKNNYKKLLKLIFLLKKDLKIILSC